MPQDPEDLITEEKKEDETPAEPKTEDGPSPMDVIMRRFDEINNELREAAKRLPEPKEPEEDKPIEKVGFDPDQIVAASGQAAQTSFMTLRKAESELRATFGDELTEKQYNDIVSQLAALPSSQLRETVSKREGHLAMGYAHLGMAFKAGTVRTKEKPSATKTTVGTEASREGDDSGKALSEFEKLYGKVTSKAQRERLSSFGKVL